MKNPVEGKISMTKNWPGGRRKAPETYFHPMAVADRIARKIAKENNERANAIIPNEAV